ncbi:alpha/beta fold hydrolase [Martelella sp. FLE1502]
MSKLYIKTRDHAGCRSPRLAANGGCTLYSFGDRIESWEEKALALTTAKPLIVVGCSVGGSCALEVAALAPDRVAALMFSGRR